MVVPQGFLTAVNNYCQHYDEITARFLNHYKLVDNTVLWGGMVEEIMRLTCDFLHHCSSA